MLPSADLRLPRAHDPQRLPVPLPGSVSAHHEALRLHVCQPRRAKGQAPAPHRSPSPASAPPLTHVPIGCFPVRVSQAVEELLTELDVDRRSVVVGSSRVRALSADPSAGDHASRFPLLCLAGVHEARRAALPGAAEGAAGHRLAGLPAGLLHGAPGPAEISQAEGETLISVPMTRGCTFETFIKVHLTFHFLFMPSSLCLNVLLFPLLLSFCASRVQKEVKLSANDFI